MFSQPDMNGGSNLLGALGSVLDGLGELNLELGTDDSVLDLLRELEIRVRRFAVIDHALVAQVERRGLARERGMSSTTAFLARLLRISAGEARARGRAAEQLASRQVVGQVLPPQFPATAAAQASGEISATHARIVTSTIEALPTTIQDEKFDVIEAQLVDWCRDFTPEQVGQLGRRLRDVLDPDGTLRDERHRERTRDLTVRQRADGSVSGSFEGTARFGEALLALLDRTSAPAPAEDGQRDLRTPGQRRHDGLLDAMLAALRAGELGTTNGVSTTIVVTMSDSQFVSGEGLARTGHGATIPVRETIKHLGDARIFPVAFAPPGGAASAAPDEWLDIEFGPPLMPFAPPDPEVIRPKPDFATRPISGYGTTHRIFTESQRLAMAARDGGCAFPSCTVGPAWTQAHHMTEWQSSRRTSVDDGCLLCGWHHREFERLGWQGRMIDGVPHFLPPPWLDPMREWQRNTAHDFAALV